MADAETEAPEAVQGFASKTVVEALEQVWSDMGEPWKIIVPLRTLFYLRRPYMTKRGFRRWRARLRRQIAA